MVFTECHTFHYELFLEIVKCLGENHVETPVYGQHICKVIQNKRCLPELCNFASCVKNI